MRLGSVLMTLVAFAIAVLAGVLSKAWLEQQRRVGEPIVVEKSLPTNKIVIATQPLRYGQDLGIAHLKEIDWPAGNIPTGAFGSIGELLKSGERRVVLSAIEVNEPILKWKITGPGQRASLSALIEPGMKAVTVRVNDVLGVAGFVLPGDRVDVLLTKTERAGGADRDPSKTFTDVILQHVRVLGVDQLADDRTETPSVVKAVTLELSTTDAQRVTLAASMGTLSLMLRPAGSTQTAWTSRITASELEHESEYRPTASVENSDSSTASAEPQRGRTIVVTRAVRRFDYAVPYDSNPQ
jgi:pilus assembly protein CpaB